MINVDRVRDTVLKLLNKEERGRITPQEFNRLGNLAQLTIFEKTFEEEARQSSTRRFDAKKDMNIREKIDVFKTYATVTGSANNFTLPSDLYRLETVNVTVGSETYTASLVPTDKLQYLVNSSKEMITADSPRYVRLADTSGSGNIQLYPATITSGVGIYYIKQPAAPVWGSDSFNGTAKYNPMKSTHFELHPSEEYELIKRILFYAGVTVREPEIIQAAAGDLSSDASIETN